MFNNIEVLKLEKGDKLYVLRYAMQNHPDFVTATFIEYDTKLKELTIDIEGKRKVILEHTIPRKIFSDKDFLAMGLYKAFIKRNIPMIERFKPMIEQSQHNYPELWC